MLMYGAVDDYNTCSRHIYYNKVTTEKLVFFFVLYIHYKSIVHLPESSWLLARLYLPLEVTELSLPFKMTWRSRTSLPGLLALPSSVSSLFFSEIKNFIINLVICCLYIPVCLLGYFTYGGSLLDTIIPSVQVSNSHNSPKHNLLPYQFRTPTFKWASMCSSLFTLFSHSPLFSTRWTRQWRSGSKFHKVRLQYTIDNRIEVMIFDFQNSPGNALPLDPRWWDLWCLPVRQCPTLDHCSISSAGRLSRLWLLSSHVCSTCIFALDKRNTWAKRRSLMKSSSLLASKFWVTVSLLC